MRLRLLLATLAALFLWTAAAAQPPPAGPIDAAERRQAVEQAAKFLREQYIYPDVAERAAAAIEGALASGAYDALGDRRAFAARVTEDLAAVTHDKHLRVSSRSAPPPSPLGGPRPRSEGGFVRADRLPGNVGYIEIMGFPPMEVFAPAADKAMAGLADTRALIIDLRRNGGGSPASVSYLAGFLLPPGAHVNDLIWRNAGTISFRTESFRTAAAPIAYRKPVYVLTSKFTFSGGEEFAYDLQTQKRATLVGDITGGGANPGDVHPLSADLLAFIPDGRAENPITKTSWEGKGVVPEIAVPAAEALTAALQKLGVTAASGDVEALSQARLFQPRTTQQPGAEDALRDGIATIVAGTPDYGRMTPDLAERVRRALPDLQRRLGGYGPLQSVAFREVDQVGGNVFDVTFEKAAVRWIVLMTPDGRMSVSFFQPAPPAAVAAK